MIAVIKKTRTTTLRVTRVDYSTFIALVDTEDAAEIMRLLKKQEVK